MGISPADAHSASFFKAGMGKAAAFKAVAHGLSRAAIAKLRYGGMKGAFLSGFVSSGFSVGAGAGYKGAFAMAIVGGTVSEIGGGKFANGAWGSAFQYLFNDMAGKLTQMGTKTLTKKGLEETTMNKSMIRILADGAKGFVGGAITGFTIGGPATAAAGSVLGLAGGLVTGAGMEAFGINDMIEQYIEDFSKFTNGIVTNISEPSPLYNQTGSYIKP